MNPISKEIIECFKRGNKIFWVGCGGSATMAAHASAEFVGKFNKKRAALPSIALTTDLATITAVGNDYGFEYVFSRQIEALGKPGDILIILSTSGTSESLVQAQVAATNKSMKVFWLPNKAGEYKDKTTSWIQEEHLIAIHQIAGEVEEAMFP